MTTQQILLFCGSLCFLMSLATCAPANSTTPDARVRVVKSESGYQLFRDGKPFKVAGAAGGDRLSALAQAGGNTVRVYHPDSLGRLLDEAAALGLAVIADLPIPPYYAADDTTYVGKRFDSLKLRVGNYVRKYKDHPALLFWILGNEVQLSVADATFKEAFNSLIDEIHAIDPNHPVSTAIVAHDLISIHTNLEKINIDFACINVFGNLTDFTFKKKLFSIIWNGPYLISEWGNNGYWEAEMTRWGAPIEPPSMTKAGQLHKRYYDEVLALQDGRCLGNLVFFWGQKYERTPTWFSFFDEHGAKSQNVLEMSQIWEGSTPLDHSPPLEYLLVDGQGAYDDVLLTANQFVTVTTTYTAPMLDVDTFSWQVHKENWQAEQIEPGDPALAIEIKEASAEELIFKVPALPGPYRIFFKVSNAMGYYATANVPVFVLEEMTHE